MNRYYYALLDLYQAVYKKKTWKELWGDKVKYAYLIIFGIIVFSIMFIIGIILIIKKNNIGLICYFGSFLPLISSALFSYFLTKKENNRTQQERWVKEIEEFNKLLSIHEYEDKDIERMIEYINTFRKREVEDSRRKYDVLWGITSVTVFSFVISIGSSIWNSYNFEGNFALAMGGLVFTVVFLTSGVLLLLISSIYDSVVGRSKKEDRLKKALQEVLFFRSVKMVVPMEEN